MSFDVIPLVCSALQAAVNISKILSRYRTAPHALKLLSSDLTSLKTTLEQRLSSNSEAPLQGINFLEPAVLDCKPKLKQALEVLERCCAVASKGGNRFKDRHRDWGWKEMEIVREQMDGIREGMQRLQTALICHTLKSPIPAEERADCLFTLRADHQCNPVTYPMRDTCTAIVSAPNRLNMNISMDEGSCDNYVKSMLNGDLFLTLDTCFATIHETEDPHREFFKHRMTTRNTTTDPRPVSNLKRIRWEAAANSGYLTCPQHPAFPSSKLEYLLHRIRKALPLNISSVIVRLFPLFFAPSVGALAPGSVSTHDRVSWVQALRSTQTDLISVSPS